MPGRGDVNQLRDELESFGRRARGLTAARLQEYPGALAALFGEEALTDPSERQMLAERTEKALLSIIAGIGNPTDRLIAEAVFAATPEFYDLNVTERQYHIETVRKVSIRELYKTRRSRIVSDVTVVLLSVMGPQGPREEQALLSPRARRAARQLYRYAQPALVYIDAFNTCGEFARSIHAEIRQASGTGKGLDKLPHGWLGQFRNEQGELCFRLAPTLRDPMHDMALWAYVYCRRYLRALLADHTGRDYLRENVPLLDWRCVQEDGAFLPAEVERLLLLLTDTPFDAAIEFVDDLCRDSQGRAICDRWLKILTTSEWLGVAATAGVHERDPTDFDRRAIRHYLLALCICLQDLFPDETLRSPEDEFHSAVYPILYGGLCESIGMDIYDRVESGPERVWALFEEVVERGPPRYVDVPDRKPVWTDELPGWLEYD